MTADRHPSVEATGNGHWRLKDLSVLEFLSRWVSDVALAQSRSHEEIEATFIELVEEAASHGISFPQLEVAAGGDLRGHLTAAIELWSGSDE
jgi:hypothetical protein